MTAPQQSQNSIYKNTSNIPRPQIDRFRHDARDSAGSALARLLKVGSDKISDKIKRQKEAEKEYEEGINVAHAQLGLGEFNSKQSSGSLDLLADDFEPNVYESKQGSLAAGEFAGQLRDDYMNEGVYNSADPAAFNTWLHQKTADKIAEARSKGKSYEAAFLKSLGKDVELMAKQYTGHSQSVIERSSQTANKERLKTAREADRYVTQQHALGDWMKGFLQSESAGNWNAWFGNAGNKEDLGQLTLGTILKRQARPGNDAAGLIQIVPSTLKGVMKKYGYSPETKFTPQVQMEMGLLLMKERGLDKWLRNEIPDSRMADRLAGVWAGLKTSKGKGVYDGDGVNKGHQGHAVTVRQLGELRSLLKSNPQLSQWILKKDPKAGDTAKILDTGKRKTPSGVEVGKILEDTESSGQDHVKMRDNYSEVIIEDIETGKVDVDDVEDEIKTAGLNKDQASRVRVAAEMRKATQEMEAKKERDADFNQINDFINTGEGLVELRQKAPKLAQRILHLKTGLGDTNIDREAQKQNAKEFMDNIDYSDPDFKENAIKEYLTGNIDEFTYKTAMKQYVAEDAASQFTSIPAFAETLDVLEAQLPTNSKSLFRKQVSLVIADMSKGDETPDVSSLLDAVDKIAARLSQSAPADVANRLNRPEYNIEG